MRHTNVQSVLGKIEKIVKKGIEMRKILIDTLLAGLMGSASAEMIASLPNKAGGRIVLTDQICKDPVTDEIYSQLRRAYNYSTEGGSDEGCWLIEDETVVVVWVPRGAKRTQSRYPLQNFTINPNYSGGGKRGRPL